MPTPARVLLVLSLLTLGCRSGDEGLDDTGDTDPEHTDDSDGPVGPSSTVVRVHVERAVGLAAAGTYVVFHDPDGEVVATAIADAHGRAAAALPDGGAVSVVVSGGLLTVLGVEPGDDVTLGAIAVDPSLPTDLTDVVVPDFPGTGIVRVDAGCLRSDRTTFTDPSGEVMALRHERWCRTLDDRLDVLATLEQDGEVQGFQYVLGVDPSATVALGATWRTDWVEPHVEVALPPAEVDAVGAVVQLGRGSRLYGPYQVIGGTPSGEGMKLSPRLPPDFADQVHLAVHVIGSDLKSAFVVERVFVGSTLPTVTVDGGEFPSPPTSFDVDAADVARPIVTWGGGTPLDATHLVVPYTASAGDAGWTFLVPGDVDHVRFPALPAALSELVPVDAPVKGEVRYVGVEGVDPHDLLVRYSEAVRYGDGRVVPDYAGLRLTFAHLESP